MKGITLKQHEVKQLQDTGTVAVWRDVKLPYGYPGMNTQLASVNSDGHGGWIGWYPHPVTDEETRRFYPNGGGFKCPYATPGEVRFVRETFVLWDSTTDDHEGDLHRGKLPVPDEYSVYWWKNQVQYRASTECDDESYQWRPSTTMPAWASRYTVTCSDVTVENRGGVWQWGIELERVQGDA